MLSFFLFFFARTRLNPYRCPFNWLAFDKQLIVVYFCIDFDCIFVFNTKYSIVNESKRSKSVSQFTSFFFGCRWLNTPEWKSAFWYFRNFNCLNHDLIFSDNLIAMHLLLCDFFRNDKTKIVQKKMLIYVKIFILFCTELIQIIKFGRILYVSQFSIRT